MRLIYIFLFLLFLNKSHSLEISYQGRISNNNDENVNFTSSSGFFKFAIVDSTGEITFWSNDSSSLNGEEPASYVLVPFPEKNGVFQVALGSSPMTPLNSSVFTNTETYLRIWFSEDSNKFDLLEPDEKITAVAYSFNSKIAETVVDSSLQLNKLSNEFSGMTMVSESPNDQKLRDLGFVNFNEPYKNLFNQGVLLKDHQKISKRSNPLAPDPLVREFGADAVRLYLMFLGPWDHGGDWSDEAFNGITRWLNRVWDLSTRNLEELNESNINNNELDTLINTTIKKVNEDLEKFKFNTSISALMEYTNNLNKFWTSGCNKNKWEESINTLIKLLSPLAPHISEELWEINGNEYSVHNQSFPDWNDELISSNSKTIVVQINGKVRAQFDIEQSKTEEEIIEFALSIGKVKENLEGKEIIKKIYVKNKLVNFAVK